MTGLFLVASVLLGASGIYLYVVAWCFRASKQRVFSLPWLLLPLSGALLAGVTLALSIPNSQASPLSLRLLELLAHLCAILLIWIIAGKIAPAYRLAGTWLYACNPLVLIELAVYANTAGIVTCLLLLAIMLLLTENAPVFRRGGGGVDDGRGRLRRPPGWGVAFGQQDAGDASVPSQPGPTPAPTEDARPFLATKNPIPAGDTSVPAQPDSAEDEKTGRRPLRSPSDQSNREVEESAKPLRSSLGFQIAALLLVGLAVRINFMTLLLVPLLLWFMVRHRRGVSVALIGFAWRALVVLAIFVLAYLPDWRGSETFLALTNGLRLFDFANSPLSLVVAPARALFTFVAQRAHFPPLMQPAIAADMTVVATAFFLFALLYLREMGHLRAHIRLHTENIQTKPDTRPTRPSRPVKPGRDNLTQSSAFDVLFTGWAVVIVGYIVLVATVFLPGYIVWGVWVVALRRFDTLGVCLLLLSCGALLYYPLQWFALASTGFLVPLGVFGIPLVYLVVQFCLPAGRMERKKVLK